MKVIEIGNLGLADGMTGVLIEATKAACSSDGCSVIAYPVNNNGSFGGRARNPNPCTTIKDANGEVIANVIGSPVRNRSDAMRIANEICQSLNANAVLRAKLKVAENALEEIYGHIDERAILAAKSAIAAALAAIREEGAVK